MIVAVNKQSMREEGDEEGVEEAVLVEGIKMLHAKEYYSYASYIS
jgi:hypothetical protein